MDGQIDYNKYTDRQLHEAASNIKESAYPKNFENLQRELSSRSLELATTNHSAIGIVDPDVWASSDTVAKTGKVLKAEKALLVALFVLLFWLQELFVDPFVFSQNIPAGRWLRFFYFIVAGLATCTYFAQRHKRIFSGDEVNIIISVGYGAILGIEVLLTVFILPMLVDIPILTGIQVVSFSLSYLLLVVLDVLFISLAFRFPILYAMRRIVGISPGKTNNRS